MLDSYFDRADARTGYVPTPPQPRDERLYYNGQLYFTAIDRDVAEARDNVAQFINDSASGVRLRAFYQFEEQAISEGCVLAFWKARIRPSR